MREITSNISYIYAMLVLTGKIKESDSRSVNTAINKIREHFFDSKILDLKVVMECSNIFEIVEFVDYDVMQEIAGSMPSEDKESYRHMVEMYESKKSIIMDFIKRLEREKRSTREDYNEIKEMLQEITNFVFKLYNQETYKKYIGEITNFKFIDTNDKNNFNKLVDGLIELICKNLS